MKSVLAVAGNTEVDFMVAERLTELVEAFPQECLRILIDLAQASKEPWGILGWIESAKKVLQVTLDAEITRADTISFIHELGARGHHDFRDLLS